MANLRLRLLAYLIIILALDGCSSGKKAYVRGNYYESVMTSTNRLRRDPRHSKSIETLREAYPMAVTYYEDRANAALASNVEFKWSTVVEAYSTINVMYDEIRRSPGALSVIPNPVNYAAKLAEAKQHAAEEKYSAGLNALALGTRDKAKLAYRYFKEADGYVVGFKDVHKKIEEALWAATLKVVMEPIPVQARNISVSAEFFDNKVSEYLHSAPVNEFVRFYTRNEAKSLGLTPDHIISIEFDEFTVGQVFMHERELKLEKDSVEVGTYVASPLVPGGVNTSQENATGLADKPKADNPVVVNPSGDQKSEEIKKEEVVVGDKKDEAKAEVNNDPFSYDKIDEKDQVNICHIPPGSEANRHTLVISRSALNAHLAHGDVVGTCEQVKEKGKPADQKPKDNKGTEKKQDNSPKGDDEDNLQAALFLPAQVLLASSETEASKWLSYINLGGANEDTVKVYSTVKATLYHYRKTTTSKGVISFKIMDSKTQTVLSAEKMPGEYIWVSEWATFNGDERALSPQQLQLSQQREQVPPQPQELFIGFTQPIFDQVTKKIRDFYKGY